MFQILIQRNWDFLKKKDLNTYQEPLTCVMCTEECQNALDWIHFEHKNHIFHVPCLLRFFEESEKMKNPLTNLPLTKIEKKRIEEWKATYRPLGSIKSILSRPVWKIVQKRIENLEALILSLDLSKSIFQTNQFISTCMKYGKSLEDVRQHFSSIQFEKQIKKFEKKILKSFDQYELLCLQKIQEILNKREKENEEETFDVPEQDSQTTITRIIIYSIFS